MKDWYIEYSRADEAAVRSAFGLPSRRALRLRRVVRRGGDPWRAYPRTPEVLAEVEALPAADRRRVLAFGGPAS